MNNRLLYIPLLGFLWLLVLAYILTIFWSFDKGLDFSDEGFYLLNLQHSQDQYYSFTLFNIPIQFLFGWLPASVVVMRFLHFLLVLISSAFLSYSLLAWLKHEFDISLSKFEYWVAFSVPILWGFNHYMIGPSSISYNHVTTIFLCLAFSTVLYLFSKDISGIKPHLFSLIGFFLGCVFFSKITTALVSMVPIIGFIAIYPNQKWSKILIQIGWTLAGLAITILLFSLLFENAMFYITHMDKTLELVSAHADYSRAGQLKKLNFDYEVLSKETPFILKWGVVNIAMIWILQKKHWIIWLILPLCIGEALIVSDHYFNPPYHKYYLAFFVAIQFILILMVHHRFIRTKWNRKTTLLFLVSFFSLLVPIMTSLGTNNQLLVQVNFSGVFWSVMIVISLVIYKESKYYLYGLTAAFAVLFALIFEGNFIEKPYRMESLFLQNKEVELTDGAQIQMDDGSLLLYTEIRNSLNSQGFEKGDPILGFFRLPGMVYALGGKSPGNIIWSNDFSDNFIEGLSHTKSDLRKLYVIQKDSVHDSFRQKLNVKGILFPEGFHLPDTIDVKDQKYLVFKRRNSSFKL